MSPPTPQGFSSLPINTLPNPPLPTSNPILVKPHPLFKKIQVWFLSQNLCDWSHSPFRCKKYGYFQSHSDVCLHTLTILLATLKLCITKSSTHTQGDMVIIDSSAVIKSFTDSSLTETGKGLLVISKNLLCCCVLSCPTPCNHNSLGPTTKTHTQSIKNCVTKNVISYIISLTHTLLSYIP